jgi:hypothetical protein
VTGYRRREGRFFIDGSAWRAQWHALNRLLASVVVTSGTTGSAPATRSVAAGVHAGLLLASESPAATYSLGPIP